jgi:endonuclease YncB( thermonuclease family)
MKYQTFLESLSQMIGSIEDNIVNDEQRIANLKKAWTAGRDVQDYKSETGLTTKQIALDAGVAPGTLDKFVRLYRLYPDGVRTGIDGGPLSLAHYSAILYVRLQKAREFYLEEAARHTWSSHELRTRVRNNYFENRQAGASETPGAKSKRALLPPVGQKLYTYGARVLKVVDGDTLLLQVDVGFKASMEHKVRLRGINCPEAKSKAGEKAVAYVRERLMTPEGAGGFVVIRSYKTEKFGRFLVDLWYIPQETDRERILREGTFLNQELLDAGLAVKYG